MAKLITTKEVLYDARDYKFGKVIIEMKTTRQGDFYHIEVIDTAVKEIEVDGQIQTTSSFIKRKDLQKPTAEVDGLYAMVSASIPTDLSYTERQCKIEEIALLVYVQNDWIKDENGENTDFLIYGLQPADFEIYGN